jgi:predicted PurR-regulated permease PerM
MTPKTDLARTTLAVVFIVVLLASSLWILRPFLGPAIWAAMVVVATWPMMLRLQRHLYGRRSLAVAVMTLLLLLLFLVPLALAVITIVANADHIVEWARVAAAYRLPETAPAWATGLPMVGSAIAHGWSQAAAIGASDLLPRLTPYAGEVTRWFVGEVGSIGYLGLQCLLTVLIAAVMYAAGEPAADLLRRFAVRLGGARAEGIVDLAGGAIRGVALGVGGTAAVQALISGLGLLLAGVPLAGLLTALIFMLCIAQIGPLPVMVPAVIWAFWHGDTGWAVMLIVVSTLVVTLDNVLRPWLIRMGADLPLLLIFAGVVGGLFAFGLVGIFVGPVVLAVAFTLLQAWIDEASPPSPAPAVASPPAPPESEPS